MKVKRIFPIIIMTVSLFCLTSSALAKSVQEYFNEGEQFFAKGQYEKAIKSYKEVIGMNPNLAEVYNKLGLAYRELNMDLGEVAWYFKTAIDIKPDFAEAYVNLARAYYGLGGFEEAEKYCLQALSIDPNLISAELSLAWIYLLGEQMPEKAIFYFERVLKKAKIPYAYFGLGMAYFMNDQRAMVLEIITNLRSMDQEDLATQLENIVRGHYYADSGPGALVNREQQAERQKGIVVPSGMEQQEAVGGKIPFEPKSSLPIQGMTRIRLRGNLINPKDMPPLNPPRPYGVNPADANK